MLKLDLKDAAQKPVREATLQDMDSDSDWDQTNPIEKTKAASIQLAEA